MVRDIIILCTVFFVITLAIVIWLTIERAQRRQHSQQRGFEVMRKTRDRG